MLRRVLFIFIIACSAIATAQTDTSDLNVYTTEVLLETDLDSILYGEGGFERLHLDFDISDTVTFGKAHLEVRDTTGSIIVFKHVYDLAELESEALITDWAVSIPFGNLPNTTGYSVSLTIENYAGALGATLTKIHTP